MLNLRVFHEAGAVWIAGDDSLTQIAWSKMQSPGVWSIPQTMTYDPSDKSAAYISIHDLMLDL